MIKKNVEKRKMKIDLISCKYLILCMYGNVERICFLKRFRETLANVRVMTEILLLSKFELKG